MVGKYFVVAGTRNEYEEFIRRKSMEMWDKGFDVSLSHFVYVYDADVLRGVSNPTGWFYGTWRERKDILGIIDVLMTRMNEANPILDFLVGLKSDINYGK